jgi:hypothetical protein
MDATELDDLWEHIVSGAKQRIINGSRMLPTYLLVGYDGALAEVNVTNVAPKRANRIVELIAIASDAQALILVAETWFIKRMSNEPIPQDLRPSQCDDRATGLIVAQVASTPFGGKVSRVALWEIERDGDDVTISDAPFDAHPATEAEALGSLLPTQRPTAEQRAHAADVLSALRAQQSQTLH